jgi:hypothetical protein
MIKLWTAESRAKNNRKDQENREKAGSHCRRARHRRSPKLGLSRIFQLRLSRRDHRKTLRRDVGAQLRNLLSGRPRRPVSGAIVEGYSAPFAWRGFARACANRSPHPTGRKIAKFHSVAGPLQTALVCRSRGSQFERSHIHDPFRPAAELVVQVPSGGSPALKLTSPVSRPFLCL